MGAASFILFFLVALAASQCSAQFLPPPLREKGGKIRASGYLQLRYSGIDNREDVFALRRLKLMVGGDLNQDWQWYTQFFFRYGTTAPNDGRPYFQEGWLRYRRHRSAQFVAGQFKPPFSRERFTPDFRLHTINRSLVVKALIPNGEFPESFTRDVGAQVDGVIRERVKYAAGLFGGFGANRAIKGLSPMFSTRVRADIVKNRRFLGHAVLVNAGGSFSVRDAHNLPFGTLAAKPTREVLSGFTGTGWRAGFESGVDWAGWAFRAEYIRAWFDSRDAEKPDVTADGYYVQLAKYLATKWQAAVKWEEFDPNTSVKNSRDVRWLTVGLNYYIREDRLKLMANYVFRWEQVDPQPNNAVLIQFQWFFL